MNRFKEVAAMFGLELGEEFDVRVNSGDLSVYCPIKFTNNGLSDSGELNCDWILPEIIKGNYTVEKIPWKPKIGDTCYFVNYNKRQPNISRMIWEEYTFELMCFKLGNCFKTEEEAEANKEKIIKMLEE